MSISLTLIGKPRFILGVFAKRLQKKPLRLKRTSAFHAHDFLAYELAKGKIFAGAKK
jgi:hypothetical protein